MTNQIARLWTVVVGVLVFFLAWAAIAAHPWQTAAAADPRLSALAARQQVLQRESLQVKQIVDRRWAAYRVALAARKAQMRAQTVSAPISTPAAAPPTRVVTLPPLVVTRTS